MNVTLSPAAASSAPRYPPIDPAPTTAIFMGSGPAAITPQPSDGCPAASLASGGRRDTGAPDGWRPTADGSWLAVLIRTRIGFNTNSAMPAATMFITAATTNTACHPAADAAIKLLSGTNREAVPLAV